MISIGTKLSPFSHRIGTQCILPGTDLVVEAFPHLLKVGPFEIPLEGAPFAEPFTVQQDLEKNRVLVFGKEFHVQVKLTSQGLLIQDRKKKKEVLFPKNDSRFSSVLSVFSVVESLVVTTKSTEIGALEKLSLGSNKAQDWDLILRRFDFQEILPLLYCMSQKGEGLPIEGFVSDADFFAWYHSSFHQMLVPKVRGAIWQEAFTKIRDLFIREEKGALHLVRTSLFPEGRFLNAKIGVGRLDFEWTKRSLRRAVLHVEREGNVMFYSKRSCRVKKNLHDPGKTHLFSEPFFVKAGEILFLDRFFA